MYNFIESALIKISVLILIYGFLLLTNDLFGLKSRLSFATEYYSKFHQFNNLCSQLGFGFMKNGEQEELANWLTKNDVKIQNEIGLLGIVDNYQGKYNNYQLILNTLPNMILFYKEIGHRGGISGRSYETPYYFIEHDAALCENALTRYVGAVENSFSNTKKSLWNPLKWLRKGIESLIRETLALLGLIEKLSSSSITALTSLITNIQAIVLFIELLNILSNQFFN
jgi:hypothetical protein